MTNVTYEDFLAAHEEHEALADKVAAKIIEDIIPFDHSSMVTAATLDSVADRLRERAKKLRRGDEDDIAA